MFDDSEKIKIEICDLEIFLYFTAKRKLLYESLIGNNLIHMNFILFLNKNYRAHNIVQYFEEFTNMLTNFKYMRIL